MKNLLATLILAFTFVTINAQTVDVYLHKKSISWMQEKSAALVDVNQKIQTAYEELDFAAAGANKSSILKYVNEGSSAIYNMSNIVTASIENNTIPRATEMEKEEIEGEIKVSELYQKLVFEKSEAESIIAYAAEMKKIRRSLLDNKFKIHPGQETAPENLEMINEFTNLLTKTARLYNLAAARS